MEASGSMRSPPPTATGPREEAGLTLDIEGMHCASCISRVESALREVDGVDDAAVNLAAERATVSGPDLDMARLAEAVERAG
jgi:P-type Cu+ transporter